MEPESRKLVGTILNGTYRIERLVAEGGMGAVYEAAHLRVRRRFAVKVLIPELAGQGEALTRFSREAEVVATIGHPHIVEIVDYNHTPDGAPYLVMELLEGETLHARLARELRLPLSDAARIFMQAASALQSAHSRAVIHRDLKPQNLFLCRLGSRDDFVKVVDFGLSKFLSNPNVTRSSAILGTPWYMAPEQARDSLTVDHRADIWAMGVVLYEMLSGQLAFPGQTPVAALYKVVNQEPQPLRTHCPGLPASVEEVVLQALRKAPGERHASMRQFWEALACALPDGGVADPETEEDRRALWPPSALDRTDVTARPANPAPASVAAAAAAPTLPAVRESLELRTDELESEPERDAPPDVTGPFQTMAAVPSAVPPVGPPSRSAAARPRRAALSAAAAAILVAVGGGILVHRASRTTGPQTAALRKAPSVPDRGAPDQAASAASASAYGPSPREPAPSPADGTVKPPRRPARRTAATLTGALNVSVTREDGKTLLRADLRLDGRPVGPAPRYLPQVRVGPHIVEAYRGKRLLGRQRVSVQAAGDATVHIRVSAPPE